MKGMALVFAIASVSFSSASREVGALVDSLTINGSYNAPKVCDFLTKNELNSLGSFHMAFPEGSTRCAYVGKYLIKFKKALGNGKSGVTYLVTGETEGSQTTSEQDMVLKVEKPDAVESLDHEVEIMRRLAVDPQVQHCVMLREFGWLRTSGMFLTSSNAHGLLMSKAAGVPLDKASLTASDISMLRSQATEFAEMMQARGLIHADLNGENVFWDAMTHEFTVIDFGNSVDSSAPTPQEKRKLLFLGFSGAVNEMRTFLKRSEKLKLPVADHEAKGNSKIAKMA